MQLPHRLQANGIRHRHRVAGVGQLAGFCVSAENGDLPAFLEAAKKQGAVGRKAEITGLFAGQRLVAGGFEAVVGDTENGDLVDVAAKRGVEEFAVGGKVDVGAAGIIAFITWGRGGKGLPGREAAVLIFVNLYLAGKFEDDEKLFAVGREGHMPRSSAGSGGGEGLLRGAEGALGVGGLVIIYIDAVGAEVGSQEILTVGGEDGRVGVGRFLAVFIGPGAAEMQALNGRARDAGGVRWENGEAAAAVVGNDEVAVLRVGGDVAGAVAGGLRGTGRGEGAVVGNMVSLDSAIFHFGDGVQDPMDGGNVEERWIGDAAEGVGGSDVRWLVAQVENVDAWCGGIGIGADEHKGIFHAGWWIWVCVEQ